MAKGRIEQEIALVVTGVEDVKTIDRQIAALERKKHKLTLDVDDGGAAKKIGKLDQQLEDLAKRREVAITANVDKALQGTKEVLDNVNKLDGETATVVLGIKAAELESTLSTIRQELAQIDGTSVDVEVRARQAAELVDQLDKVKSTIQEVNATPVEINTKGAAKGMNDISDSACGANSALANVVGNASQDFAALGGVAGTAGVALGQFGEYVADAKLSGEGLSNVLSTMGKVAVPLAAIGVVFKTITGVLGSASEESERAAESVDQWVQALEAGGSAAANMTKQQQESGKVILDNARNFDTATKILTNIPVVGWFGDDDTEDITSLFSALNAGMNRYNVAVTEGGESEAKFRQAVAESNLSGEEKEKILTVLGDDLEDYGRAQDNVANNERIFAQTTESLNAALESTADPLSKNTDLWKILVDDLRDGKIDSQATADAVNKLNHELKLTPEQILAIAQAGLDKQLEADADAAAEAVSAYTEMGTGLHDLAVQQEDAAAVAKEFSDIISSTDFAATGIDGATAGMSKFHDQFFGLANIAADSEEAFDNLSKSLEDNGKSFDLNTEKGRANQKALEDLGSVVDVQLVNVFDNAGGSLGEFSASAKTVADTLRNRLINEMGLSATEADELIAKLGLMPDDIETRYKLSGTEEAKLQLQLLEGTISRLPKNVQGVIDYKIAMGDYVGAQQTAQNYMNRHPVTIPVELRVSTASLTAAQQRAINAGRGAANGTNSMPEPGGIAGEAGGEFVRLPSGQWGFVDKPTYMPPRTKVISVRRTRSILRGRSEGPTGPGLQSYAGGTGGTTMLGGTTVIHNHTNVNAAVVGSRYDVAKAVGQGNRDLVRLLGRRGTGVR